MGAALGQVLAPVSIRSSSAISPRSSRSFADVLIQSVFSAMRAIITKATGWAWTATSLVCPIERQCASRNALLPIRTVFGMVVPHRQKSAIRG